MKRAWIALVLILAFTTVCLGAEKAVEAPDDCKYCGMNRTKFAHSRMVVNYEDGSTGTCSINCIVIDMKANKGKAVKSFQVGDYDSKKLIDAKTASWVIGGNKRGVMTPVAKWAFADKAAADKFIKTNGGKPATFNDVLKATEKELAEQDQHKGHGSHKM